MDVKIAFQLFLVLFNSFGGFTFNSFSRKTKASMWWNLALMDDWTLKSQDSISTSLSHVPYYSQAFTKRQQNILEKHTGALWQVVQAARLAVAECKRQMSWRRWNCSTNPSLHPGRSIFGGIVRKGYKETSFLHALSSATLAYSIARACSEGRMKACSCDTQKPNYHPSSHMRKKPNWINNNRRIRQNERKNLLPIHHKGRVRMRKPFAKDRKSNQEIRKRKKRKHRNFKKYSLKKTSYLKGEVGDATSNPLFFDPSDLNSNVVKEWQWGGCNDNIDFGYKFSKMFIDSNEQDRDLRCAVNKHNNEAGRQHVKKNTKPVCKCHGLSGSCSIKTCWIKLAPFWFIGHDLKLRFDGASKVNHGNDILKTSKIQLQPVHAYQKPPSKRDLVYYEESPRFCKPNPMLSHPGVQGKECKKSSKSVDACDVMCCGRGYRKEVFEETLQCNCTFNYCCTVVCEKCSSRKTKYFCL